MSPGFSSPRDYADTLTMGLRELLADEHSALMTVVAHARWSGQAARAAAIREFLGGMPREEAETAAREDVQRILAAERAAATAWRERIK